MYMFVARESNAYCGVDCQIQGFRYDEVEDRIGIEYTRLLTKAFGGQPVPEGTPFKSLSAEQKRALELVKESGEDWWGMDDIIRSPLRSYGFDFYEEGFLEFLKGEQNSK